MGTVPEEFGSALNGSKFALGISVRRDWVLCSHTLETILLRSPVCLAGGDAREGIAYAAVGLNQFLRKVSIHLVS
jgi:hypothetical protein